MILSEKSATGSAVFYKIQQLFPWNSIPNHLWRDLSHSQRVIFLNNHVTGINLLNSMCVRVCVCVYSF